LEELVCCDVKCHEVARGSVFKSVLLFCLMVRKLKVGVFSFTCCEGCCISVIESLNSKMFDWQKKIDFVNFKALKKVGKIQNMDVAFIEGAISTDEESLKLQEIRVNARVLVALGSGAINGWPSNLRNNFKGEVKSKVMERVAMSGQNEKVVPAKEVVKFDDEIFGCPISEEDFVKKMKEFLNE